MTLWPRLLGIVGGLGPHAHLMLEQHLLDAAPEVLGRALDREQDYPPWLLSSLPATPDRTACLLDGGASPVDALVRSLHRLQGRADFALIACNTAHAFLDAVRPRVEIPILDMVGLAVRTVAQRFGATARIGVLATSGTLQTELYPNAARRVAPAGGQVLRWCSLLDLAHGDARQAAVMAAIFGLKAGDDPRLHRQVLLDAAEQLRDAGADAVVLGCTEISMALRPLTLDASTVELVDPLRLAAVEALRIASGQAALPA